MGKKNKKKQEKKNFESKLAVKEFISTVEDCIRSKGLSNKISVAQKEEYDEITVSVYVPMNSYTAIITGLVFDGSLLEVSGKIKFNEYDDEFEINDIIDLYDINDFEEYNIFGEFDEKIVDFFLKYDYEIKKARETDEFKKLVKIKAKREKEADKDEALIVTLIEMFKSDSLLGKYRRNPNKKTKGKLIKYYDKLNAKGKLKSKEKRLLNRLKSEEDVLLKLNDDDRNTNYSKCRRKIYSLMFLFVIAVVFLIYIPVALFITKDSVNGLSIHDIIYVLTLCYCFWLSVVCAFGKRIVQRYVDKKGIDAEEYKNNNTDKYETYRQFIVKYIAPLVFSLLALYYSFDISISAIKPDSFVYYHLFNKQEYVYSELIVYKALGSYDNNRTYTEYSLPYFYFVNKDGDIFGSGLVDNEREFEKIETVFKENNISVNVVKSVDDII